MRRTASLLFALCLCAWASAYEVSESEALGAAARFFDVRQSALELVCTSTAATTKASGASGPEYYIINRSSGGFVIISGDNASKPVVAYSLTGGIDPANMPEALSEWLDGVAESVRLDRKKGRIPDLETIKIWETMDFGLTKAGTPVKNLHTVQWNQSAPFYNSCPIVSGRRCLTGCTATALSELMCYYGWPEVPTGVAVPQYTDNSGNVYGGYTLNTTYDWSALQALTTQAAATAATDDVKENLSLLLRDVGMVQKAKYGPDGTGASFYLPDTFCPSFSYNRGARLEWRSNHSEQEWEDMIRAELDMDRPVFYTGFNPPSSGHAFLFDGYDNAGFFHINLGWGGSSNAFVLLEANYASEQQAYFDLYPDPTGTSTPVPGKILLWLHDWGGGVYNYKLYDSSEEPLGPGQRPALGVPFIVQVARFFNGWGGDYSGSIKIAHKNKNGQIIEDVSPVKENFEVSTYYRSAVFNGCQINQPIGFGDQLVVMHKPQGSETWSEVLPSQTGETVSGYCFTPYPFIDLPSSCPVGTRIPCILKNHSFPYMWSYYNSQDICTQWCFYRNGDIVDAFDDAVYHTYTFDAVGEWMVVAIVKDYNTGEQKTVLSAAVTVY